MKSALATDLYQLTMMAGYVRAGLSGWSTFNSLCATCLRTVDLVAAWIAQAVEDLSALRFYARRKSRPPACAASLPRATGSSAKHCLCSASKVMCGRCTKGNLYSPVLFADGRVRATPPQAQLVETALLAIINFQTLIASKAARIVSAAAGRPILEFGTWRAHGLDAALYAARAAYVAGCAGTSNVEAGFRFGIPISGTMADSWVQSFPTEIDAFRAYLETYGHETTLLVDTYDMGARGSARSLRRALRLLP